MRKGCKVLSKPDKSYSPQIGEALSPAKFFYQCAGLSLESSVVLPELREAPKNEQAKSGASITIGVVPKVLPGGEIVCSWLQILGKQFCLITVPGVARYLVSHGSRIVIEPATALEAGKSQVSVAIRTFLLGTVLGALLYQRSLFVLHASAIEAPSGVWAFSGPSGYGKSTLAAWCNYTFEFPILTDDLGVLDFCGSKSFFYPGPPRLKLWADSLASISLTADGLTRDLTRHEKYHIELSRDDSGRPRRLRGLILLSENSSIEKPPGILRLRGVDSYRALMKSRYKPELNQVIVQSSVIHSGGARLADSIPIYRLDRPWSLGSREAQLEVLRPLLFGNVQNAAER
jgi:hypothetical protein